MCGMPRRPKDPDMAEPKQVLIVVAPYYEHITNMLIEGACAALEAAGCEVHVRDVPGALEVPVAIRIALEAGSFDGFIALGCVIRGETSHYETVTNDSSRGLMDLGTEWGVPIGNGILTVENEAQAIVRADPAQKNKGADAAAACIALMDMREEFQGFEDDFAGGEPTFRPDSEHIQIAGTTPTKTA